MSIQTEHKQPWDEDPIILCIVLISISITLIGDFIKCLLQIHLPTHKNSACGSCDTSIGLSSRAASQPPSHSTNAACVTVDLKREVGTTSKAGPSVQSASSPRSKPSAKPSSSKSTQEKSLGNVKTISDGTPGLLASPTATPRRTRKNVRTTAD